jgi:hypothetical protein
MYSDRSSARVQTTSVAFEKNEGSPRSRSSQTRAAVTSRTPIPANSATVMAHRMTVGRYETHGGSLIPSVLY